MKHNEIKSFFKKRLQTELDNYGIKVLSIDETNSTKMLYLIKEETLETQFVVKCYFSSDDYAVRIYEPASKINYYRDFLMEAKSQYVNLAPLYELIGWIKFELIGTNSQS